jgi:hypothetical protein
MDRKQKEALVIALSEKRRTYREITKEGVLYDLGLHKAMRCTIRQAPAKATTIYFFIFIILLSKHLNWFC